MLFLLVIALLAHCLVRYVPAVLFISIRRARYYLLGASDAVALGITRPPLSMPPDIGNVGH